jgi:hypothetical protein
VALPAHSSAFSTARTFACSDDILGYEKEGRMPVLKTRLNFILEKEFAGPKARAANVSKITAIVID